MLFRSHLLAWGAEPNRRVPWFPDDPNGPRLSALHFVTSRGDAALARQLLAAGAEPRPGMVVMSPQMGYTKPAPTLARTSRTFTV